jgi:hypothetical protein
MITKSTHLRPPGTRKGLPVPQTGFHYIRKPLAGTG